MLEINNEKNLHAFSYTYNMANFEALSWAQTSVSEQHTKHLGRPRTCYRIYIFSRSMIIDLGTL